MHHLYTIPPILRINLIALLVCMMLPFGRLERSSVDHPASSYIVQGTSAALAAEQVKQAGGVVLRELAIINAVSAVLPAPALARLRNHRQLQIYDNGPIQAGDEHSVFASGAETDTAGAQLYPAAAVDVAGLHERKIKSQKFECTTSGISLRNGSHNDHLLGFGVTVAILDSGFLPMQSSGDWSRLSGDPATLIGVNSGRCIVYRDFVATTSNTVNSSDLYGHGTHVAATIADGRKVKLIANQNDTPVGVAPDANLVLARVLGEDGSGNYADVIAGIDWIVANRERLNIRVLNLSLYAPVTGPYWADPLNQAVMRAWQSGIVVVAAAGNDGPEAGTITAPGNIPYVITVGALASGRYTASGYDELADFSARGPTESAFVKPDLVIPATRTIASMPSNGRLAQLMPGARLSESNGMDLRIGAPSSQQAYYQVSGTSMAAAQVSGVVALMLQAHPELTNDQVKYRLMSTARLAIDPVSGSPRYSIWEQGAGLLDASAAIDATTTAAANAGLDIAYDLNPTGTDRYWGYTVWNEASGEFRLLDPQSGQLLETWAGGRRSWAGADLLVWGSGRRAWAGSDRPWISDPTSGQFSIGGGEAIRGRLVAVAPDAGRTVIYLPLVRTNP